MSKEAKPVKAVRRHKAPETVRERAAKQLGQPRLKDSKLKAKMYRPLSTLRRIAQKEFNPIRVPQNRWGRVLGKRFNLIPLFLANAWKELRQVNWPSRKDALRLTFAVVVFAVAFAIFVQIFGFLFERLIKYILTS
jgi:preprotein translocase SecE subunit